MMCSNSKGEGAEKETTGVHERRREEEKKRNTLRVCAFAGGRVVITNLDITSEEKSAWGHPCCEMRS
jgi:hypothetical protein